MYNPCDYDDDEPIVYKKTIGSQMIDIHAHRHTYTYVCICTKHTHTELAIYVCACSNTWMHRHNNQPYANRHTL